MEDSEWDSVEERAALEESQAAACHSEGLSQDLPLLLNLSSSMCLHSLF